MTASPPTSWEALNNPEKFVEIVNVTYASGDIAAKGIDGKLYYLETTSNQWGEIQSLPPDYQKKQELPIKKLKSCPKGNKNFPTKEPPGIIAECVFQYTSNGPGITGTYIVLLEDGKVWRWHPQARGTDMPILSFIIGPFLGLLVGLITGVFFVYLYLRFERRKGNSS